MALDAWVSFTLALAFSTLLLVAAGQKLKDLNAWLAAVADYQLLPLRLTTPVGMLLVAMEVVIAVGLLLTPVRALAAAFGGALWLLFALALAINLLRGRTRIDCGCLGAGSGRGIAWWMVVRNLVLMGLVGLLALPTAHAPLSVWEIAAAVTLVASAALLYPVLDVVMMPRPATFDENYRTQDAAVRGHHHA
jgi:hypothetical protein